MRFLPYILAGFLSISFVGLKLYREFPMGKKIYADLSSLNRLLETPLVGSTDDSYYYFISAYAYYKNFLPVLEMDGGKYFVSFRFLSSWVFVPFMWLFKDHFPLAYIIFFTFAVMLLFVFLLEKLGVKTLIIFLMLFLISPIVFYHIPRLMLEGPTVVLILLFLILFFKGRFGLSLLPLSIAGLIRGEMAVICLIFGIYALLKTRKNVFVLSFLPILVQTFANLYFGDQSNFYFWAYRGYLENLKGVKYSSEKVEKCVQERLGFVPPKVLQATHPYLRVKTDCVRDVLKAEIKPQDLNFALRQITLNFLSLIFYIPTRLLAFLPKPFIVFYVLYSLVVIASLIFYLFKGSRLPIFLYFSLIIIYSLYNPFGLFDFSRFKVMLVPFETVLIASLLSGYRSLCLKPRQF
jgi:hypothetical protein